VNALLARETQTYIADIAAAPQASDTATSGQ
jgi:hypothetical protein